MGNPKTAAATDKVAITDQEAKEYIASAIENLKIDSELNLRIMPFGNKIVIVFNNDETLMNGEEMITTKSGLPFVAKFQGEVEGSTIGLNVYRRTKKDKPKKKQLVIG